MKQCTTLSQLALDNSSWVVKGRIYLIYSNNGKSRMWKPNMRHFHSGSILANMVVAYSNNYD